MKAVFRTIEGVIDRRMLINFVADPTIVARHLPKPFRPQLYKGNALVGICLIRLRQIRPKGWPGWTGISSENAAHRFAVEWDEEGGARTGVYIPRRDSSSFINHLAGGRVFPGQHHWSKFRVKESDGTFALQIQEQREEILEVRASRSESWSAQSVFPDLAEASHFFRCGDCGYSPSSNRLDAVQLCINNWEAKSLQVEKLHSRFFSDEASFPYGSIRFDHALLMLNIPHEWRMIRGLDNSGQKAYNTPIEAIEV
ncbi:MAG: DUF2071 domain-containing protein [Chitinophagaceae bacterium]